MSRRRQDTTSLAGLGGAAEAVAAPSARRLGRVCLRVFRRALSVCGRWAAMGAAAGLLALAVLGFLRSELEAPPPSTLLLDRHGSYLGEHSADAEGRHGFWPLEQIPPRVAAATVAVEDRRFWRHPGVDPAAVARAFGQNLRSGRTISGASTLAMQVARLQRPGDRTYARKALEASTALWLVGRHGRRAVLLHYLRLVPYGNQVHGIAHAARRYFDKPVADLSWAETAFLAAIPQAPARMNPYEPRGRARAVRRGLQILELLRDEQLLPAEEYRLAATQIKGLRIPPRASRPEEAMHAILRLGDGQQPGAIVRTTLELELQRDVTWMARQRLEAWRRRGAGNVAALVVELPSGGDRQAAVRAAVGSADFFDDRSAGAIDYLRVPRSSGSTLKPFFYASALDRGLIEPTGVLDDLERGAGGISNADGRFLGPLLPRFALANSRNVPAANLLAELGLDEGWSLLGRLGLHAGLEGPRRFGLGLTIGSLAVTVEDLASAFTALATDGRQRRLRWLAPGQRAVEPSPGLGSSNAGSGERRFSEQAARLVTHFLADSQARLPSFPRTGALELPFPAAMKTGTSSRYRDAWTVAYTPRFLVVVWVGHPDHRPMQRLSGYRTAAPLARQILLRLHPEAEDGLDGSVFPPPRGYEQVATCALTGRAAAAACDRVAAEWRRVDAPPLAACTAHRLVAIEKRSGRLASHETAPEALELRTFLDLPARYAAWQAQAGLPRAPLFRAHGTAGARRAETHPSRLEITSPADGLHLFFDPETPKARNTLALSVVVEPAPQQILWTVNGEPFALADYPFTERWPLVPGDHLIQAQVPFSSIRSAAVRVRVE